MTLKDKKKLIFLHLPKNGGSTFNSILDRLYPDKNTFVIKVVNPMELNTDDFINLPSERRNEIKLLRGHMHFGLHKHLFGESDYITFLRRPEERIVSYYYYVLRQPTHRLHKAIAKGNLSLFDFVEKFNENDLHNAQIRWISGIDAPEEEMLEKAIDNINRHFSFIGFQERFDESLIILKKMFKWPLPYYQTINRTKNKASIDKLDTRIIEAIRERNIGDTVLYEKMKRRFDDELLNCENLNRDLAKIKVANKLYSMGFFRKCLSLLQPYKK